MPNINRSLIMNMARIIQYSKLNREFIWLYTLEVLAQPMLWLRNRLIRRHKQYHVLGDSMNPGSKGDSELFTRGLVKKWKNNFARNFKIVSMLQGLKWTHICESFHDIFIAIFNQNHYWALTFIENVLLLKKNVQYQFWPWFQ